MIRLYTKLCRTAQDWKSFYDVEAKCFAHDILPPPSEYSWVLLTPERTAVAAFGAEVKGRTVFLSRCSVVPDFQGYGLQKRSIRYRCATLRDEGFRYFWTYVHPQNAASQRSLIRCGFMPYDPERYWDGTWVYYRKIYPDS